MLTIESTTYPSGWGKRAGTHRTWTASYRTDDGRVIAAQAECPLEAAAQALEFAREQEAAHE